jgi:hypothetical protein
MTANQRCVSVTTAITVALLAVTLSAAGPVQIYPPSGPGGPIVIAVLADHYSNSQADQDAFAYVADYIFNTTFLHDPHYYGARATQFKIVTLFQAVPAGSESNYGFSRSGSGDCDIHFDATTTTIAINDALSNANIAATKTVVIGNYDYNFGCRSGNWVYIAAGAAGSETLEHEMGHLLGDLFDEYAQGPKSSQHYPGYLNRLNCSTETDATKRDWAKLGLPGVTDELACELYGFGIWHPFLQCRMGASRSGKFCDVCRLNMDASFEELTNPPPPVSIPRAPTNLRISGAGFFMQPPSARVEDQSVRVLARFDRIRSTLSILSANDVAARTVPHYRRTGDYVYELTDHGNTFAVGVIGGDPFQVRVYRGGSTQHSSVDKDVANIEISIPGVTRDTLVSPERTVEILIYRLDPRVNNEPITPARLVVLKTTNQAKYIAKVNQDDLKKAAQKRPIP